MVPRALPRINLEFVSRGLKDLPVSVVVSDASGQIAAVVGRMGEISIDDEVLSLVLQLRGGVSLDFLIPSVVDDVALLPIRVKFRGGQELVIDLIDDDGAVEPLGLSFVR